MTKLSIIIPIYNNATYLKQCLNSITAQNFNDFEILCINDASTDNSTAILNSLAAEDSRIRIFNLPSTQGAGAARNLGISHAKGEYIHFWTVMIGWNQTYTHLCSPKLNKPRLIFVFFNITGFMEKPPHRLIYLPLNKQNKSRVFMTTPNFSSTAVLSPGTKFIKPLSSKKTACNLTQ